MPPNFLIPQICLKVFVLLLFLIIFCWYLLVGFGFSGKDENILVFKDSAINNAIKKRYITSSFEHPAELGNMLFRFASLYGIGKTLGRIPYVNASIKIQLEGLTEISEYFPVLHEYIEIKVPAKSLVTVAPFSDTCCIFESPQNLKKFNQVKYLKVSANYLQSYKFFHHFQPDIQKLMECSTMFKMKAAEIADEIWKNDRFSHKFCIHVRRGDFVNEWPLETRMDFTDPATKYIYSKLTDQTRHSIALLILGNDPTYIENMTFPKLNFSSINNLFPYNTSRSFDMCFGIEYCDTLLISASSSTFGWWIGYLMKSKGQVYYNAIITKFGITPKDTHDFDLFLPNWKKLLLQENGNVKEEFQWTVARNTSKT